MGSKEAVRATSPRVLVIEDDAAIAELVRYNLEAEGLRPTVAATGEEAELQVAEDTFDLIVLDWMLPGLSGIELCRRLRRRESTRSVPILMLTARGEEADRVRGLSTGADDYVVKPFSVAEMVARVKALLRRAAPERMADSLRAGDIVLDRAAHRVTRREREVRLGHRVPPPRLLHGELGPRALAPAAARRRVGPRRVHRRAHGGCARGPAQEGAHPRLRQRSDPHRARGRLRLRGALGRLIP